MQQGSFHEFRFNARTEANVPLNLPRNANPTVNSLAESLAHSEETSSVGETSLFTLIVPGRNFSTEQSFWMVIQP
jgi:hypothetical protein